MVNIFLKLMKGEAKLIFKCTGLFEWLFKKQKYRNLKNVYLTFLKSRLTYFLILTFS